LVDVADGVGFAKELEVAADGVGFATELEVVLCDGLRGGGGATIRFMLSNCGRKSPELMKC
jgi:hypothetical protein